MAAGRLLLFPRQQVSPSFRQQFLVLPHFSSDNTLIFSVILMTTCCLSILYSKDRRFSFSPLVYRPRMVILSLFWKQQVVFFFFYFLIQPRCSYPPLFLWQQVVLFRCIYDRRVSFSAFILYQPLVSVYPYAYGNWRYSSENIELSTSLNLFMRVREHPRWTVTPA